MDYLYFIGIDISKDFFEVACHGQAGGSQRYANTPAGYKAFTRAYRQELPQALVVMEATGGYEQALLHRLVAAGYAAHRAHPLQAKHFIRSLGRQAKTDRLDALALARYGAERQASLSLYALPDPVQEQLQGLLIRRTDLVAMRVAERNRLQHPRYAMHRASLEAVITVLTAQIEEIEAQIAALITASSPMQAKLAALTSVKGVGIQTAYTLLALMPELGTLTRRQAASLAGCAPHPRDSGSYNGYRRTTGGRALVKRALFLAAMAARNFHPTLKAFYERLIAQAKKPMVALTAIMRKLITILNAKLRDLHYA